LAKNRAGGQAIARTDPDELENLYCKCRQQLFTCALVITRSATRAEDAVHDAFYQLLRGDPRPSDLKSYVFRAVRNAALNQVRRSKGRAEALPSSVFDPGPYPDESAEKAELQRRVEHCLSELSPDERETIVEHLFGELTFQEIAIVRGAALGTVVSWYRRGLEKLRARTEMTDGSV
jgi:RNA polymerase sigma-70 factor, ECF subfamily